MERTAATSITHTATASQKTKPNKALEGFDKLPDSAFVRVDTVAALRNCSRASVWRHAKQGLLPSPRKISAGITAWNVGELRRALAGGSQ